MRSTILTAPASPASPPAVAPPIYATDVNGAATACGVSCSSIRRAVAAGKLKQIKIGAATRFRLVDIETYLARLADEQPSA